MDPVFLNCDEQNVKIKSKIVIIQNFITPKYRRYAIALTLYNV